MSPSVPVLRYRISQPPRSAVDSLSQPYLPYLSSANSSDLRTGDLEVASELALDLFERAFLKGDFVKHSLLDSESALVVDVQTECLIEHVISGERLHQWVPWNKLRNAVKIEAKDKVVYDHWIGTVEEVFEDGLLEAADGSAYRIAEMGGLLETGRYAKVRRGLNGAS